MDPASDLVQGVALANAGDGPEALALLLKAAESGNKAAATNAGWMLLQGKLVPPDFIKGRQLLEDAAAGGDGFARLALARMHVFGLAGERNTKDAVALLQAAAETPAAPEALFLLAGIEHMATGNMDTYKERCRSAYALGNRIAIEQCLDYGGVEGGFTDFAPPRFRQIEFAVALAPWYRRLNIEAQYASAIFLDSDDYLRQLLGDAAVSYEATYHFDVTPLIAEIGKSRVRAADLVGGSPASSPSDAAPGTASKPATTTGNQGTASEDRLIAENMGASCDVGPASYSDEAVHRADLTGDGIDDLALDMGFVTCGDGGRSNTCGFRTCEIYLFVARETGLDLSETFTSIGVEIMPGNPPRLGFMSHDFQRYERSWDGSKFAEASSHVGTTTRDTGWQYGEHPVLGLSAYTAVGEGAIGIACAYSGTDAAMTGIAAVRATPDLAVDGALTVVHVPSGAGGTMNLKDAGQYLEYVGNTCDTNLLAWQKGSKAFLSKSKITGFTTEGDRTLLHFETGETLFGGDDPEGRLDGQSISLKGSSAAISKLIKACRAVRQDIEWNCGI